MVTFGGKGGSLKKAFGQKGVYELEIQKVARFETLEQMDLSSWNLLYIGGPIHSFIHFYFCYQTAATILIFSSSPFVVAFLLFSTVSTLT